MQTTSRWVQRGRHLSRIGCMPAVWGLLPILCAGCLDVDSPADGTLQDAGTNGAATASPPDAAMRDAATGAIDFDAGDCRAFVAADPIEPCQPFTCADVDVECGYAPDGCGDVIDCGGCEDGGVCGGSGPSGVCDPAPTWSDDGGVFVPGHGCEGLACCPTTCAREGAECGTIADGCGGLLDCGDCEKGSVCGSVHPNRCTTTPTSTPPRC